MRTTKLFATYSEFLPIKTMVDVLINTNNFNYIGLKETIKNIMSNFDNGHYYGLMERYNKKYLENGIQDYTSFYCLLIASNEISFNDDLTLNFKWNSNKFEKEYEIELDMLRNDLRKELIEGE